MNIEIGSFATFADYFFDGLIADWVVRSRIRESLDRVMGVKTKVKRVMDRLDQSVKQTEEKVRHLNGAIRNLVEGYTDHGKGENHEAD